MINLYYCTYCYYGTVTMFWFMVIMKEVLFGDITKRFARRDRARCYLNF